MPIRKWWSAFFICVLYFLLPLLGVAQANSRHVRVSGYYRKDGTYVQPYFRTAPNHTNRDNFSTQGNTNPYTGKPGWVAPDDRYNTFYYNTNSFPAKAVAPSKEIHPVPLPADKDRTYIQDEYGRNTTYLKEAGPNTFNIYDRQDKLLLILVINHRGDWRLFNTDGVYIKTIFVKTGP